jgi:hypothetical protein
LASLNENSELLTTKSSEKYLMPSQSNHIQKEEEEESNGSADGDEEAESINNFIVARTVSCKLFTSSIAGRR